MKISEVSLHTRVMPNYVNGDRATMIGEIVSDEVKKPPLGGQFQVLVKYDRESSPRWVSGNRLVKVDW